MNKNLLNSIIRRSINCGCLYSDDCKEKTIKSHSVQNSKVFDMLSIDGHLMSFLKKNMNPYNNKFIFQKVGRNDASTFNGLCSKHDNDIFKKIDIDNIDLNNNEQLFLMCYRSFLKEYTIKITSYRQFQNINSELEKNNEQLLSNEFILINDITYMDNIKNKMNNILIQKDFFKIKHYNFIISSNPLISCSQFLSIDSIINKNNQILRIFLNIFPFDKKTSYIIFSSFEEDYESMIDYINDIIIYKDNVDYTKYLISKFILNNCENFYIKPSHFDTWSGIKKQKIINSFNKNINMTEYIKKKYTDKYTDKYIKYSNLNISLEEQLELLSLFDNPIKSDLQHDFEKDFDIDDYDLNIFD